MSWKSRYGKKQNKRAAPHADFLSRTGMKENDVKIVQSPPGHKMSEVILEFIEPYRDDDDHKTLTKLVTIAAIAWNLTMLPKAEQVSTVQTYVESLPAELRESGLEVLLSMIQRKLQHFASNKRMIIEFKVTPTRDGPHLEIISTLLAV